MRPSTGGTSGFFSSRELYRLTSAIFLLGIVGLLYVQSKKSSSWRTVADDRAATDVVAPVVAPGTPWKELVVPHPGHTDAEEIDALKEELQAVSDMSPLAAEEMPAYWRMVKWASAIPGEELRKQARTDLLFTHLFQAPDKNRGALVNVKLHVRRIAQADAPTNSADVKRVYEAWGPTEESQTYPYCIVFVDPPVGVDLRPSVFYDARFVGFFLKKLPYEDATGTKRTAPLLIGRMVYDEAIALRAQPDPGLNIKWIIGIVGGLVLALLAIQSWAKVAPAGPRTPLVDESKVDAFLDDLESGVPPRLPERVSPESELESEPPD